VCKRYKCILYMNLEKYKCNLYFYILLMFMQKLYNKSDSPNHSGSIRDKYIGGNIKVVL